jgi:hypothetical protein
MPPRYVRSDRAGRERLRHQVQFLVIAPPAATFLAVVSTLRTDGAYLWTPLESP